MVLHRCVVVSSLLVGAAACTAGGQDETSFTGSFTGPTASTTPPGVTTFEETEGPDDADGPGTMGASSEGSADTTASATTQPAGSSTTTTTDDGTTTNSEECNPPCDADEICVLGACVPAEGSTSTGPPACNDVPANYEACLGPGNAIDTSGCGGANNCLTAGDPTIAGVCTRTPCVDTCDCPLPGSGTADVACDAITAGPENFCFLDCSTGQTCPTGMVCYADFLCMWPGEGADGVPYGDCFNDGPSTCGLDGICLNDDVMMPTVGVCAESCAVVGDCAPSPGGTAPVTCEDLTTDGMSECYLDCSLGSCPAGMTCFGGFICIWN